MTHTEKTDTNTEKTDTNRHDDGGKKENGYWVERWKKGGEEMIV